jgi:hypothetical protein
VSRCQFLLDVDRTASSSPSCFHTLRQKRKDVSGRFAER